MRKVLITIVLIISSASVAFGQYLPEGDTLHVQVSDVTLSKEYRNAKSAFVSGLVVAGIGNLVNIAGNVICLIEQNRFVNSHDSFSYAKGPFPVRKHGF